MSVPARLVTTVDLAPDAHARRLSVTARLHAVLDDGRRVLLLGDRGWSEELRGGDGSGDGSPLWWEQDVADTARVVVGPDEPFGGRSQADMETDHWQALADTLRARGLAVDGRDVRQLPHDVVLGEAVRAWLAQRAQEA